MRVRWTSTLVLILLLFTSCQESNSENQHDQYSERTVVIELYKTGKYKESAKGFASLLKTIPSEKELNEKKHI